MEGVIESRSNKIFKELSSLKDKHGRDKRGLFFAEGERLVKSIPESTVVKYFVISESASEGLKQYTYSKKEKTCVFSEKLFKELSDTVNSQGIICVCEKPHTELSRIFDKKPEFIVVCEDVRDPGNLGTIIRTADAGGAGGVILSKGCTDLYSPKVLRSAMGSVFNLPVVTGADMEEIISIFKKRKISSLAAHLRGSLTPYEVDMKAPTAIFIGNEARGLSENTAESCDSLVKLPIRGGAESLNASVACGILIYEAVRQRRSL